jgi:hypothetical protein
MQEVSGSIPLSSTKKTKNPPKWWVFRFKQTAFPLAQPNIVALEPFVFG